MQGRIQSAREGIELIERLKDLGVKIPFGVPKNVPLRKVKTPRLKAENEFGFCISDGWTAGIVFNLMENNQTMTLPSFAIGVDRFVLRNLTDSSAKRARKEMPRFLALSSLFWCAGVEGAASPVIQEAMQQGVSRFVTRDAIALVNKWNDLLKEAV